MTVTTFRAIATLALGMMAGCQGPKGDPGPPGPRGDPAPPASATAKIPAFYAAQVSIVQDWDEFKKKIGPKAKVVAKTDGFPFMSITRNNVGYFWVSFDVIRGVQPPFCTCTAFAPDRDHTAECHFQQDLSTMAPSGRISKLTIITTSKGEMTDLGFILSCSDLPLSSDQ